MTFVGPHHGPKILGKNHHQSPRALVQLSTSARATPRATIVELTRPDILSCTYDVLNCTLRPQNLGVGAGSASVFIIFALENDRTNVQSDGANFFLISDFRGR